LITGSCKTFSTQCTTISPQSLPRLSHHVGPSRHSLNTHTPCVPHYRPTRFVLPATIPSHSTAYLQPGPGIRVFHHIRDLSGIVGSESVPLRRSDNPNFNATANSYFWIHGYQRGTIQLIQQTYEASDSAASFAESIAVSGGISIMEGQYIYGLIKGTY